MNDNNSSSHLGKLEKGLEKIQKSEAYLEAEKGKLEKEKKIIRMKINKEKEILKLKSKLAKVKKEKIV